MIPAEWEKEPDDEPQPVDPFSVMCPFCHVLAGEQCRNQFTKEPLRRFDAHPIRWTAARHG